jgi:hypothetical protein
LTSEIDFSWKPQNSDRKIVIIDKGIYCVVNKGTEFTRKNTESNLFHTAEWNEAQFDSGQSAFSVEYDIVDSSYRLLHLDTNTFCSAGGFLKNGTLISTGGGELKGRTWKAKEGWHSIRYFTPCEDGECQWSEYETEQMTGNRWYPTVEQMPEVSQSQVESQRCRPHC